MDQSTALSTHDTYRSCYEAPSVCVHSVCDDVNARGSLELCSNEISIVLADSSALTLWFSTFLTYSSLKNQTHFHNLQTLFVFFVF